MCIYLVYVKLSIKKFSWCMTRFIDGKYKGSLLSAQVLIYIYLVYGGTSPQMLFVRKSHLVNEQFLRSMKIYCVVIGKMIQNLGHFFFFFSFLNKSRIFMSKLKSCNRSRLSCCKRYTYL